MVELLERVWFTLVAFLVALLPERVKARQPWKGYSTTAAHVASGLAEFFAAIGLFVAGLRAYYVRSAELMFLGGAVGGLLTFLGYLVTPTALVCLFCFGEGMVRAIDAGASGRHLGLAFLSLPHWVFERARARAAQAGLEAKLGPPRPDRVEHPDTAPDGCLRITSRDPKPWSDVQVVEFEERFYLLVERTLLRDGRYSSWRYRLRPLEPREVLRGAVVAYAAPPPETRAAAADPRPATLGSPDLATTRTVRRATED